MYFEFGQYMARATKAQGEHMAKKPKAPR